MSEHPIIFSGPMVRAILAGRKTQTRRLVTPRPPPVDVVQKMAGIDFSIFQKPNDGDRWSVGGPVWAVRECMGTEPGWRCPYGAPGDLLWVRETFCHRDKEHHAEGGWWFAATDDVDNPKWTPSIYMPRSVSRITLRVTGVRVERVADISDADAIAEGARHYPDIPDPNPWGQGGRWQMMIDNPPSTDHCLGTARHAFLNAWDIVNGKRAPASTNPWVWAVTFEVVP